MLLHPAKEAEVKNADAELHHQLESDPGGEVKKGAAAAPPVAARLFLCRLCRGFYPPYGNLIFFTAYAYDFRFCIWGYAEPAQLAHIKCGSPVWA